MAFLTNPNQEFIHVSCALVIFTTLLFSTTLHAAADATPAYVKKILEAPISLSTKIEIARAAKRKRSRSDSEESVEKSTLETIERRTARSRAQKAAVIEYLHCIGIDKNLQTMLGEYLNPYCPNRQMLQYSILIESSNGERHPINGVLPQKHSGENGETITRYYLSATGILASFWTTTLLLKPYMIVHGVDGESSLNLLLSAPGSIAQIRFDPAAELFLNVDTPNQKSHLPT